MSTAAAVPHAEEEEEEMHQNYESDESEYEYLYIDEEAEEEKSAELQLQLLRSGQKRAASQSPPLPPLPEQMLQQQQLLVLQECGKGCHCHGERHDPVRRCEQVTAWKQRRHALFTVSPAILQRCVERYIQWVAERRQDLLPNNNLLVGWGEAGTEQELRDARRAAAAALCRTQRWRIHIPTTLT